MYHVLANTKYLFWSPETRLMTWDDIPWSCLFVRFLFCFSVRVAGCCCVLSPWGVAGLTRAKSSCTHGRRPGYTLNESPAHCRNLTDGSSCPTGCQLHIRSNSCSRILWHVAQSHPRGAGDSNQQTSDHWSTSSHQQYLVFAKSTVWL